MSSLVTRSKVEQDTKDQIQAIRTMPSTVRPGEEVGIVGLRTHRIYKFPLSDVTLHGGSITRKVLALESAS